VFKTEERKVREVIAEPAHRGRGTPPTTHLRTGRAGVLPSPKKNLRLRHAYTRNTPAGAALNAHERRILGTAGADLWAGRGSHPSPRRVASFFLLKNKKRRRS
jgi:hypothetical protein